MFSGNFEKQSYELKLTTAFETGKRSSNREIFFMSLSSKCVNSKKTQD